MHTVSHALFQTLRARSVKTLSLPALLLALSCMPAALPAQDFDSTTHSVPNPQNSEIAAAQAALDARDFPKAVKLLRPLASANPHDARLLFDLGSAQDALDQSSAAETSYKQAIEADPKLLEPHLALGLLEAREGRLTEAHGELVTASTSDGDALLRARAFRALARIDQSSRPDDARDELLAALKISPETPEDTLLTAELASAAGAETPAAEAALRKVLAARPNDPEASADLARILMQQKRQPEAEATLRSALEAHPADPVVVTQLATLLSAENKPGEALTLVGSLHKAQPNDSNITHLLASLEAQTGDFAAAEPLYAELCAKAPKDMTLVDARADMLIHLKRFGEAEQLLAAAVAQPTLFPTPGDLGDAAGHFAFAASENNDPARALQALAVRATVLPPSPPVLFLQAISEDKLHHVKQARLAYRDFLEAAKGGFPDQEFEAKHRLVALEHMR
jgi:Flp pilus assembly protein TadD